MVPSGGDYGTQCTLKTGWGPAYILEEPENPKQTHTDLFPIAAPFPERYTPEFPATEGGQCFDLFIQNQDIPHTDK